MNSMINRPARCRRIASIVVCALLLIGGTLLSLAVPSSPVTAQPPEPQRTAVSPLLGGHPEGKTGTGSLPPGPATVGLRALSETTASPRYRPGVVKQFEETSYYLRATDFVSATLGWAVGYPHWDQAAKVYTATVIQTADGGETWSAQATGTGTSLYDVDFVSDEAGWAVGATGTILHTDDGGATWISQTLPITGELRSVRFVDADHGWATAVRPIHYDWRGEADNWKASIWHTDDGVTWVQQSAPANASILHDVDFIDTQTGWAVGARYTGDDPYGDPEHAAVVYHTSDGGITWEELYSPELEITFTSLDLVDANHGWVAGFPTNSGVTGGTVFGTSDGGETWERHEPGGSIFAPLWDIEFLDPDRGYVVGADYIGAWGPPVWRTLDGGETWEKVLMDRHENDGLFGLSVMEDRVVALGDHDYVVTSTDPWGTYEWPHGENLFSQAYINVHYRFEDVFFLDEETGWAVGSTVYTPTLSGQVIFHTSDGGATWGTQHEHASRPDALFSYHRLDGVFFADAQTGWAVGTSEEKQNTILHTHNGGVAWQEQGQELYALYASWELEFFDVQFFDDQEGWALATDNFPSDHVFLAHTVNGGSEWDWVDTGVTGNLAIGYALVQGELSFTDDQHGWAVGGLGQIVHTADGGTTWITQTLDCGHSSCPTRLFAVEMLDNQEGWIAGEGLFHTRDGGDHWNMEDVDIVGDFQDVQFVDALNGWLAGDGGAILVTRDGGATWHEVDNDVSSFTLRGVSFVTQDKGWLVGDYGTILTTIQIPYWPIYLPLVTQE